MKEKKGFGLTVIENWAAYILAGGVGMPSRTGALV